MLARLATVQGVLASKSLSRSSSVDGSWYAESTYGRAVDARLTMDCSKKASAAASFAEAEEDLWVLDRPLWPRKDSRPEENANDPRGRAESDNKSKACSDGDAIIGLWSGGLSLVLAESKRPQLRDAAYRLKVLPRAFHMHRSIDFFIPLKVFHSSP